MQTPYVLAIFVGLLCLCGCRSPSASARGADPASGIEPDTPVLLGPAVIEPASIPNVLRLADAQALALKYSPRLQAFDADKRAAAARVLQAGRWPNPELAAETENVAGSGALSGTQRAETEIVLAQAIPLGGDIDSRRALAETGAELANWDYLAARVAVVREVTQRFVQALAAEERLSLARRNLELAETTERITAERVEAGDVPPIETSRAAVPVMKAELEVRREERLRDAFRQRLARTWGAHHRARFELEGKLESLVPPPATEALAGRINRHPAVARWTAEIGSRMARRKLAEAEAMPDVTARVGLKHENELDDVALVAGLALPLPLFDRRQGDIRAARWSEHAATLRRHDAKLRVEALLNNAYVELANAYDEATILRDRGLPAVNRAYEGARNAFDAGKIHFLEVLDAQRTLFGIEQDYIAALVHYHTARAQIEALIGVRLDALDELEGPTKGE